jgi:hypothetical protein
VMLCQLDKNCIGAIAGMNGDIGVDKVSRDRATPSIPPSQRNFDRLRFSTGEGFGIRRRAETASFKLLRAGTIVKTSPRRVILRSMSVSARSGCEQLGYCRIGTNGSEPSESCPELK